MRKTLTIAAICSLLLLAAIGLGAASVSLPYEEQTKVSDPINETIIVDVEFNESQLGNLPGGSETINVALGDPSGNASGTQTLTGDANNSLATAEFVSLGATGNYTVNVSTQLETSNYSSAVEEVYIGGKDGSTGAIIGLDGDSSTTWILLGGAALVGWIWYRESDYEL